MKPPYHDMCHNLHGKVDARAFADGCAQEQRKLYGCAPDADEAWRLQSSLDVAVQRMRAAEEERDDLKQRLKSAEERSAHYVNAAVDNGNVLLDMKEALCKRMADQIIQVMVDIVNDRTNPRP